VRGLQVSLIQMLSLSPKLPFSFKILQNNLPASLRVTSLTHNFILVEATAIGLSKKEKFLLSITFLCKM